jgi:hypothetical protein
MCGQPLWIAYHHHRTVVRLDGLWRLTIRVRQCVNAACAQYHQAIVPEEAGAWALPQGEFIRRCASAGLRSPSAA